MTEINTINTRFQNYKTINNFLNKNVINSTNGCLIHSKEPNKYLYTLIVNSLFDFQHFLLWKIAKYS